MMHEITKSHFYGLCKAFDKTKEYILSYRGTEYYHDILRIYKSETFSMQRFFYLNDNILLSMTDFIPELEYRKYYFFGLIKGKVQIKSKNKYWWKLDNCKSRLRHINKTINFLKKNNK